MSAGRIVARFVVPSLMMGLGTGLLFERYVIQPRLKRPIALTTPAIDEQEIIEVFGPMGVSRSFLITREHNRQEDGIDFEVSNGSKEYHFTIAVNHPFYNEWSKYSRGDTVEIVNVGRTIPESIGVYLAPRSEAALTYIAGKNY